MANYGAVAAGGGYVVPAAHFSSNAAIIDHSSRYPYSMGINRCWAEAVIVFTYFLRLSD
jgi:hypothetical protein